MNVVQWELIQAALNGDNGRIPLAVAKGDEATMKAVDFLRDRLGTLSAECNSEPAEMVYSGVAS